MVYRIEYSGQGTGIDADDVFGIQGTLLDFVDSNQADYDREYGQISHTERVDGAMTMAFRVTNIPESDAPGPVLDEIDDFIEFEINGPNGTDFPLSQRGATIER